MTRQHSYGPWYPADIRRLRALWSDETMTVPAIARAMGRSYGSVTGRAHALHLPRKLPSGRLRPDPAGIHANQGPPPRAGPPASP